MRKASTSTKDHARQASSESDRWNMPPRALLRKGLHRSRINALHRPAPHDGPAPDASRHERPMTEDFTARPDGAPMPWPLPDPEWDESSQTPREMLGFQTSETGGVTDDDPT